MVSGYLSYLATVHIHILSLLSSSSPSFPLPPFPPPTLPQFELPGSWGDVASMINAPEPNPRHHLRGQKPVHTKTQYVSLFSWSSSLLWCFHPSFCNSNLFSSSSLSVCCSSHLLLPPSLSPSLPPPLPPPSLFPSLSPSLFPSFPPSLPPAVLFEDATSPPSSSSQPPNQATSHPHPTQSRPNLPYTIGTFIRAILALLQHALGPLMAHNQCCTYSVS